MSRRIITIDCQYLHPRFAAAYLLIDGDRAAFIDNNTSHSVPLLLSALQAEGLAPEQVDYVIITHVHLDHAGGTSQLMNACPRAKLLAHPRAARHMIDPSKLVASARHVYGADAFDRMYGRIDPVDAKRVQTIEDETLVPFGSGAPLRFFHTRGHANHHFCIQDPESSTVFTGDSFGLAYPVLQRCGPFIFPSTSPTDFDYAEALLSIDKILATNSHTACLTHFGEVHDLPLLAAMLRDHLKESQDILLAAQSSLLPEADLSSFCERRLRDYLTSWFGKKRLELSSDEWDLLKLDIELNAQGLAFVAQKKRNEKKKLASPA